MQESTVKASSFYLSIPNPLSIHWDYLAPNPRYDDYPKPYVHASFVAPSWLVKEPFTGLPTLRHHPQENLQASPPTTFTKILTSTRAPLSCEYISTTESKIPFHPTFPRTSSQVGAFQTNPPEPSRRRLLRLLLLHPLHLLYSRMARI